MSNTPKEIQRLKVWITHTTEKAEMAIVQVNGVIQSLVQTGIMCKNIHLAAIILEREYTPGMGPSDSAQFIQAAMHLPNGIGAVLWDIEEYHQLRDNHDELLTTAMMKFVPFVECDPAVKVLLLPEVPGLLERLLKRLN